jgi:hypothetical protein
MGFTVETYGVSSNNLILIVLILSLIIGIAVGIFGLLLVVHILNMIVDESAIQNNNTLSYVFLRANNFFLQSTLESE